MLKKILTKGTQAVGKMRSSLSAPKYQIVTGNKLSAGDFVQVWDEESLLHGMFGTISSVEAGCVVIQLSEGGPPLSPTASQGI